MFRSENLPVAESKRPSGANGTQDLVVHKEVVLGGMVFKVSRGQRQTHFLYTTQQWNSMTLTEICAYQNK
jgi:hypothetical protein